MVPAAVELANKEWRSGTRVFGLTMMALIVSFKVMRSLNRRHTIATPTSRSASSSARACATFYWSRDDGDDRARSSNAQALFDDIPIMAIFTFLLLTPLLNGLRLHRWEARAF